jgi:hypothetical protein
MKFINILKSVLSIGANTVPSILEAVSPGWGALINTIVTAILNAEATLGSGKGAQKKNIALDAIQTASPVIVALIEKTSGHTLVDPSGYAAGVASIQDGLVSVFNAFRILPKSAAAVAAPSVAAAA